MKISSLPLIPLWNPWTRNNNGRKDDDRVERHGGYESLNWKQKMDECSLQQPWMQDFISKNLREWKKKYVGKIERKREKKMWLEETVERQWRCQLWSLVVAPLAMMPIGSGHVSSERGSVVGMKMGRKIKENVKKEKKIEEKWKRREGRRVWENKI